jgi:hypothetical protein
MPLPESAAADPRKPSRWSLAIVLFALLLLIPGLCFSIAGPIKMQGAVIVLAIAWVVVLLMWLLVLLVKGILYLVRQNRR